MTELHYPSVGDAVALNAEFVSAPIRDVGLLESALARPRASAFGQDAYPDVWSKAAALLHSIVVNHPFVDANKRTGLALAVMLLGRNGVDTTSADQDALFDLLVGVALGKPDEVEEVASALAQALNATR